MGWSTLMGKTTYSPNALGTLSPFLVGYKKFSHASSTVANSNGSLKEYIFFTSMRNHQSIIPVSSPFCLHSLWVSSCIPYSFLMTI